VPIILLMPAVMASAVVAPIIAAVAAIVTILWGPRTLAGYGGA
jgi:hypothetical protein